MPLSAREDTMPIRRELRQYYSAAAGWPQIRERILTRAGGRCERCGVRDGVTRGTSRVVLTVAHLDQNPANNDERNLQALCQRCHLNFDRPFNQAKAQLTRTTRKDQLRPLLNLLRS